MIQTKWSKMKVDKNVNQKANMQQSNLHHAGLNAWHPKKQNSPQYYTSMDPSL